MADLSKLGGGLPVGIVSEGYFNANNSWLKMRGDRYLASAYPSLYEELAPEHNLFVDAITYTEPTLAAGSQFRRTLLTNSGRIIAFDPFVITAAHTIAYTDDNGITWSNKDLGVANKPTYNIASEQNKGNVLDGIILADGTILLSVMGKVTPSDPLSDNLIMIVRSTDNCETFSIVVSENTGVSTLPERLGYRLATNGSVIRAYTHTTFRTICKISSDLGATWSSFTVAINTTSFVTSAIYFNGKWLVWDGSGRLRSSTTGTDFNVIEVDTNNANQLSRIFIFYIVDGVLFTLGSKYYSVDGVTWNELPTTAVNSVFKISTGWVLLSSVGTVGVIFTPDFITYYTQKLSFNLPAINVKYQISAVNTFVAANGKIAFEPPEPEFILPIKAGEYWIKAE